MNDVLAHNSDCRAISTATVTIQKSKGGTSELSWRNESLWDRVQHYQKWLNGTAVSNLWLNLCSDAIMCASIQKIVQEANVSGRHIETSHMLPSPSVLLDGP